MKILFPVGCRSDEGLSAPIIKRLKQQDWCKVSTLQLNPQDFFGTYQLVDACCRAAPPDLIFLTGDRVEMCAAAAAAFHNKAKIAHYYAGVINDPTTTYDDIDRHIISMWSDIQFCESEDAEEVVWDLKHSVGLKSNTHVVGISHLDDLVVDESKVPLYPYDLVLMNKPSLTDEPVTFEPGSCIVHIGGNPDGIIRALKDAYYYGTLPRPQFLGLLKNCQRFITNSSSAIYEAPHFLKPEQIIMVGDRNKNRPRGPFKTGASDEIVRILKEFMGKTQTGA